MSRFFDTVNGARYNERFVRSTHVVGSRDDGWRTMAELDDGERVELVSAPLENYVIVPGGGCCRSVYLFYEAGSDEPSIGWVETEIIAWAVDPDDFSNSLGCHIPVCKTQPSRDDVYFIEDKGRWVSLGDGWFDDWDKALASAGDQLKQMAENRRPPKKAAP